MLLERESELDRIESMIVDARRGAGGTLLFEGTAGVGKTELLTATRERAAAAGLEVLSARGGELERGFPYTVVRQLFEERLVLASRAERAKLLSGAAVQAGPALDLERTAGLDQDASFATQHGLYWLAANLSSHAPLLIAVDDGHWSDEPSLRWLSYLAPRIDELPMLVAIAARPPPDSESDALKALSADDTVTVARPMTLSAPAVGELIAERFGITGGEKFTEACHSATGGNPFLVQELLKTLAREDLRPGPTAVSRVRELGPRSVAAAVLERIARLPQDGPGPLANAVAILGTAAQLRRAAALAELDQETAARAADALAAAEILTPARRLDFVHPLVRRAVHDAIPAGLGAQLHLAAARLLESEGAAADEVAAHLLHADERGDANTVAALRRAASGALSRGAPDAAVAFLERALAEPPPRIVRGELLFELGSAQLRAGGLISPARVEDEPAAIGHLRLALELAVEPAEHARAAGVLADALLAGDRFGDAVELLDRSVDMLGDEARRLAPELEAQLMFTGWLNRPTWISIRPRVAALEPPLGATPAERLVLGVITAQRYYAGADADTVAELAARAVPGGPIMPESLTPQAANLPGLMLLCAERFDAARAVYDRVLGEAHASGQIRAIQMALTWRSFVFRRLGLLADAEADAQEAIALAAQLGWGLALPVTRSALADVLLDRGEPAAAITALGDVAQDSESLGWNWFLHSRGRAKLALGNAEDALEDLLEAGRRETAWGEALSIAPWRSSAALAYHALGDTQAARALAAEELELARAFGAPRQLGLTLRVAGLVGVPQQARSVLEEAVGVLEGSPARFELAQALVDFGAALRRDRRRADAREPLRRGLDLAHRCGATAVAGRALEELAATGARPRRLMLTGVESLTASERRVATMAAAGDSNRDIAQALFVTQRTVETHLSSTYRKLDVNRREELAAALAGQD